jgi:capsular exopolysaccharide synthesis family protein
MPIEKELGTYMQVLLRYKWVIVTCGIVAAAVAFGISSQLTPLYSADATVRVASAPGGTSDYVYSASATRLSNTYVEIATSEISLNKVMERLGLQKKPSVEVAVVPETELISISASDPDPRRARDIVNTLAGLMVEQSMELYGGDAPTARVILEEQLQQAKVDLDSAVSEYDQTLRSHQSVATQEADAAPIPNPDVEMLGRIVTVRQQIYGDLLQRYETARTNEQLRANAITIVQPASLPLKPSTPKVPLNTALGLVAGLAMGMILAFLFEGMDRTVRDVEDVAAMTPLPILCMIPEVRYGLSPHGTSGSSQEQHFSPLLAFDQLRARLLLLSSKSKTTTFLITSPEPRVGKSTVAANLAISLVEGGNKVVLVDMDFRRPRQHSILGLPNEKGLSHYLRGEIPLDAALQSTINPNLRVIVAGSTPHVSTEWTTPVRIDTLFKALRKECDYVLIDSPALLSVADPTLLASQVDAVILVVARHKTERPNLHLVLQEFAQLKVKIAGIVMNKMPNSQLYSYYSTQYINRSSFGKRKLENRIAVETAGDDSGKEQVDAI